jgi:RNA polymerase sigma-70 factor (ECF subfamily)
VSNDPDAAEAELWQRSLDGDAEAFGRIFDRHRDRVFRQARRLTESREDAEDISAAAFLELWRRRQHVRLVHGSALPWLLVTTTNVARNAARARRRYRAFLTALPKVEPERDAETLAMERMAASIHPDMRAALIALPAQDLHLLTLVAFEDLPLADAAAVLEITPAAAKSRLHRVRAHLREQVPDLDASVPTPGGSR